MHLNEFHVLLVDDEPDVHEISRLAMRHFKVYGLPIRLHSAHSKAEAIHEAIEHFAEEHHHQPDAHEKARLVSDAIKEWEHEEVEIMHEGGKAA